MTDPITDMLNQIRNAQAVGKPAVTVRFSALKNEIALLLSRRGFLGEVKKISRDKSKWLRMQLKYDQGVRAIEGARRISKPGQRIYRKAHEFKKVRGGFGIAVVSTPKGLMDGREARQANLGGEVLLEIW